MNGLHTVVSLNMSTAEAETYKIALIWEAELEKMFSKENLRLPNGNRLPKKTDPRKCALFRHCWKIRRELKDLIRFEEFKLFIRGNLFILKKYDAAVDISAMTGEKAWLRWKVYDRWLKQKRQETAGTSELDGVLDRKIVTQLDRSKKFIFNQFQGQPSREQYDEFAKDGFFNIWVGRDNISKYYVALSPFLQPYAQEISKACRFDLNLFTNKASDGVRDYFKQEFAHEFGS